MNRPITASLFVICLSASLCPTAAAQTDLSKFALSKAIPSDCYIAVAARTNPERKFLDDYWAEVHTALMESGILTDIWDLILESVPDEQLETVEEIQTRFSKLCGDIEWGQLFEKDFMFAGRFVSPFPQSFTFEGVVMGRSNSESVAANYKNLKAILQEIVKLVESHGATEVLSITETNKDGCRMTSLGLTMAPGLGLSLATYEDVIAIGMGTTAMLDESLGLLRGTATTKGLVQSERFKKAFKTLPPAEDTLVFFDTANMMTKLGDFFKKIDAPRRNREAARRAEREKKKEAQEDGESGEDGDEGESDAEPEEEFNPLPLINRIIGDLTFVDYVATVEWTEGHRVFTESVSPLMPGAKENEFTAVFTDVKPLADFAKFIPEEATTFSSMSGMNFSRLYGYVRQLCREDFPKGAAMLRKLDSLQEEEWGLSLDNDIFKIYNGPITSIQMGDEWAMLVGVSDAEKARDQLKELISFVTEKMGKNQQLMISQVDVGGKNKFTQVTHPVMMMMGGLAPVIGVAEGQLMLGSSTKAVGKIISTAQGKSPNITKSKQWRAEAIVPKEGKIDSISFTDERKFGEELQQGLGAMSMAMGMATMAIQSSPDVPPFVQSMCRAVPPILAKLGPVAAKLNFYQSSSSYTTFDGKQWHTRMVQNYKDPAEVLGSGEEEADAESTPRPKSRKVEAADEETAEEDSEE